MLDNLFDIVATLFLTCVWFRFFISLIKIVWKLFHPRDLKIIDLNFLFFYFSLWENFFNIFSFFDSLTEFQIDPFNSLLNFFPIFYIYFQIFVLAKSQVEHTRTKTFSVFYRTQSQLYWNLVCLSKENKQKETRNSSTGYRRFSFVSTLIKLCWSKAKLTKSRLRALDGVSIWLAQLSDWLKFFIRSNQPIALHFSFIFSWFFIKFSLIKWN